ncbi:hypothetical protein BaRGS_00031065 [Batillaria attramentaria]|uniref:non-specific serine/threonine protein kinase n=1 Tax=Batillaria attramentaria TaxID=370345 RepID=A0ABD0JRG0_9CAEN
MTRMNNAQPHFVRCVKSNEQKAPDRFQAEYVLQQLRSSGVLDIARIRQMGYPVRIEFTEFVNKYKLLVYSPLAVVEPTAANCLVIVKNAELEDFEIGASKDFHYDPPVLIPESGLVVFQVYLKFSELDRLNKHLRRIEEQVILIQKHVRGYQMRKRYRKLRQQRREEEAKRKLIEEMTIEALKHRTTDRSLNENLNDKFKQVYDKDSDGQIASLPPCQDHHLGNCPRGEPTLLEALQEFLALFSSDDSNEWGLMTSTRRSSVNPGERRRCRGSSARFDWPRGELIRRVASLPNTTKMFQLCDNLSLRMRRLPGRRRSGQSILALSTRLTARWRTRVLRNICLDVAHGCRIWGLSLVLDCRSLWLLLIQLLSVVLESHLKLLKNLHTPKAALSPVRSEKDEARRPPAMSATADRYIASDGTRSLASDDDLRPQRHRRRKRHRRPSQKSNTTTSESTATTNVSNLSGQPIIQDNK